MGRRLVSDQSMLRSDIFFSIALAGGAAAVRLSPRMAAAAAAPIRITPQEHSVALVALGCPKNTVDAEVMLGDLQRHGLRVVREPENADIVVVNTCAFVEDAKRESVAAIVDAARLKADRSSRVRGLYVTGCMAQRYAEELADELPEVDAVVGFESCAASRCGTTTPRPPLRGATPLEGGVALALPGTPTSRATSSPRCRRPTPTTPRQASTRRRRGRACSSAPRRWPSALEECPGRVSDLSRTCPGPVQVPFRPENDRFQLTAAHTAYLRVAEGCDHACSFCAIPGFRGAFRSKPFDTALAEARSAEIGRDPPRYAAQPSSAELRRAEEISRDEPSSAELSRGCRRGCSSSEACARST